MSVSEKVPEKPVDVRAMDLTTMLKFAMIYLLDLTDDPDQGVPIPQHCGRWVTRRTRSTDGGPLSFEIEFSKICPGGGYPIWIPVFLLDLIIITHVIIGYTGYPGQPRDHLDHDDP